MTAGPITRTTLRDEVSRRLRSDIAAGLLEPQRLYGIAEVAVRLGVSITPVRERSWSSRATTSWRSPATAVSARAGRQ